MTKKKRVTVEELQKNAYEAERKIHQAGRPNNYQPSSATANKFRFQGFDSMRALCGCLTWKHERNTEICFPIAEQELGEILERDSKISRATKKRISKHWCEACEL